MATTLSRPGGWAQRASALFRFKSGSTRPAERAQSRRSPRVMRKNLHAYDRRIYVQDFRVSIGLDVNCLLIPTCVASYAIPVRRSSVLPAASFGFHLAVDTLAVRLAVPLTGPAEDFNPQVCAPCRAHKIKRPDEVSARAVEPKTVVQGFQIMSATVLPAGMNGMTCVL